MTQATIVIDRSAVVAPINRRIFGSFVEHLGRCVYDGIYEPGHPTANADGFRLDVVDLVKELGSTTIRYPGGNFVSGYKWEDGVGPRADRPVRRDLAWHSLESNQVGLEEFARWCALTDSELMMAVNLGTRGIDAALDLLEYANQPDGTALSEQRIRNGAVEPYDIRMWCLGNEMDGPWQIGHMSADDYGKIAARTASAMKTADKSLELVVCGSSGSAMPTFGEWERVVLEHSYEYVDYVSCHAYYQERKGDLASYLASSLEMTYFIETVKATADHVKYKLRSEKTIQLSFDEWNIWYLDEHQASEEVNEEWRHAPRQLEDVYSVADAVVLGNLLITLLQNHDRVGSASLAQLVNVIAPIMTEPGGASWRQTTFFPFSVTSRLARGVVLKPRIDAGTYDTALYGAAPLVDAVATFDAETGASAVFLVNRSQTESIQVSIDVSGLDATFLTEAVTLHDADVYARNTLADQNRVGLKPLDGVLLTEGVLTVILPPVSWSALALN
ncbi:MULTISPECIES: alpha-N-arabinofuranosidase [unclassified Cryobacterium]|uniref:arabinosylfuranosidase ArfA n=2 Tax=Bacteria TaxID=2 RepID=UPI002AB47D44|nr:MULTISPECIES: alpha-N-arabinofuranosidase [unclassified Cryobacterium]MDY7529201.1 alpha-N-arabinofuranosidase [Cryobacterium sp. 10C2]MDY7558640.1 alpha-N-arabinofuranosidase [Cryobacterium sp. 10C3]MEB0202554.1 alpha-N-arabinofuranosidase [Cryobacterium sp. 5I3]MEB0289678.1 alpha-N-arabinofuranosidase [Cryobacterium sp. 10C2]